MKKSRREYQLPHYGQIITTRQTIKDSIWEFDHDICYDTAVLIALGREHSEYKLRLYSICSRLQLISRLIYRSRGGYVIPDRKMPDYIDGGYGMNDPGEDDIGVLKDRKGFSKLPDRYYENIFIGYLEYPSEAEGHLREYNENHADRIEITEELLEYIIRCKTIIAAICCHFMEAIDEQFFISEYAYAFDYVLSKKGDLPMPEYGSTEYRMDKHDSFFPTNYKDFYYSDETAKAFEDSWQLSSVKKLLEIR